MATQQAGGGAAALAALGLGAVAACFSNGNAGQPLAAIAAPAMLLLFVMRQRVLPGTAIVALVWSAASFFMFRGAIPMPDGDYAVASIIGGCISALPYLLHRVAAPQLGALAGSLVFPAAATALPFVLIGANPFGSWGHDAYMMLGVAPVAQLAAVAGLWGIAFAMMWVASSLAGLIGGTPGSGRVAAMVGIGVAAMIGFGLMRLQQAMPDAPPVRVAALNNPAGLPDRFFAACSSRADRACRSTRARERWQRLFAASAAAARDGARIVAWPESAAQYDARDEAEFLRAAADFARTQGLYLIVGAARVAEAADAPMQNKALLFTPLGQLAFTYHKSVPVPGEPIRAGDGIVKTLDTPFGRLAVMICFDADFPALARQAAARGADLLIIPSNDWRDITPLHADMVRMRGIENGMAVVRPTSNGVSLIADPFGRVLARVSSFDRPGVAAMADLRPRRVETLYGRIGDGFGWLAVLLAIVLPCVPLLRRWRAPAAAAGGTQ